MRILSLYYGHDANCTLLEEGEPVVVLEKERLTRIKHDQGIMDLDPILTDYGWTPDTIDVIVFNPYVRPTLDDKRFDWTMQADTYEAYPEYHTPGALVHPKSRCRMSSPPFWG